MTAITSRCNCKAEAVTRNLKKRANRFADQDAVWDGVGQALFALGAASPTRALSDAYDCRANAIDDYLAIFKPHPGHFSIDEAVDVIQRVGPKKAYLTHMSHDVDHETTNRKLPPGIELAYDGLTFEF